MSSKILLDGIHIQGKVFFIGDVYFAIRRVCDRFLEEVITSSKFDLLDFNTQVKIWGLYDELVNINEKIKSDFLSPEFLCFSESIRISLFLQTLKSVKEILERMESCFDFKVCKDLKDDIYFCNSYAF